MIYNVLAFTQDYDYVSDEVVYSFSTRELAEECQNTLKTVYDCVEIFESEIDTYIKPHKLYHCSINLDNGNVTEGFQYTYQKDIQETYYKSEKIDYFSGEIREYSLNSQEEAKNKCNDSYNHVLKNRIKVVSPYNKDTYWWMLKNLVDNNLRYIHGEYYVDGVTGMTKPIKPYQSHNMWHGETWNYLKLKCSG